MKKIATILLFLGLYSTPIFSQSPTFIVGIRSGVNTSNYKYSSSGFSRYFAGNSEKIPLFTLGLQGEVQFSKHFALQTELNFMQKGYAKHWEYINNGIRNYGDSKLVTNWLEIPFLAKINFGKRTGLNYGFFLGPSLGYALNGKFKTSSTYSYKTTTNAESVDFKRLNHERYDFALNFGGDISYKRLFLDVRYHYSLKNLAIDPRDTNSSSILFTDLTETNISMQTQNLMFTLGYRMSIRKEKKEVPKTRILRDVLDYNHFILRGPF